MTQPHILQTFSDALHKNAMKELEALRVKHRGRYDHDLLMVMVLRREEGLIACRAVCGQIIELTMQGKAGSVLKRIEELARAMLRASQ